MPSLKLTAKAPENGWLEDDRFLLQWPIFRGYVSFRGVQPWYWMAILLQELEPTN